MKDALIQCFYVIFYIRLHTRILIQVSKIYLGIMSKWVLNTKTNG